MGTLQSELNRLAGTTGLDAQGAANAWAGTTGLDLVGALNAKAGTRGLELQGVVNTLAGTKGIGVDGALSRILMSDSFNRSVSGGWGTADSGQAWTIDGGAAANFSVSGGAGVMAITDIGGNSLISAVGRVANFDVRFDLQCDMAVPTTGGNSFFRVSCRVIDSGNNLEGRAFFTTGNQITLNITELNAGVSGGTGTFVSVPGANANSMITLRFRGVGPTIMLKGWITGQPEPDTWQQTFTTTILSPGSVVRLWGNASGSFAGPLPYNYKVENLLVSNLGGVA